MTRYDMVVFLAYLVGIFAVGLLCSSKVRTSGDLFTAGRQAPWWVAGVSSFMTMFSAATFVVWGGIAYKHGMVAVVVTLTYGVAAIFAGFFLAGRWRDMGVSSAAEFIELRFGSGLLACYTVLNIVYKLVTVAVSIYSVAILFYAVMPGGGTEAILTETNVIHPTVVWLTVALGTVVLLYTVAGGLWAVLVTDLLQFVVLTVAVAFAAPLILAEVGGVQGFVQNAPPGFLNLTVEGWTWWIIAAWCALHFLVIGAEWAFVQRNLCVPTAQDARKGNWLFGVLYLVSPLFWMLPPMLYRTIDPNVDPRTAYIVACQAVLPVGMTGLVLAAMVSATASMVDSQLNVFAGVLTNDYYRKLLRPESSERTLLLVGRVITIVLGVVLTTLACFVPLFGAENTLVHVGFLLIGPLLWPVVWGLFSRKISGRTVLLTWAGSVVAMIVVQVLLQRGIIAATEGSLRAANMLSGVVLPGVLLAGFELVSRATDAGWNRVATGTSSQVAAPEAVAASAVFPIRILAWSLVACALVLLALIPVNASASLLIGFSTAILAMAAGCFYLANRLANAESVAAANSTPSPARDELMEAT